MAGRRHQGQGAAQTPGDNVDASMLQEAVADLLRSNMVRIQGADHFMKILSTGVFNTKPFYPEEDFSYSDVSDCDDDDDDDEDDGFYSHKAAHQPKEPHSRITELTDEMADKLEMITKAEDERCKEKKEKNKRKKMELDFNNSYAVKSVPEETCNQKPAQKSKLVEVPQLKEEKPKVVENPVVQKKKEEKHEANEEKTTDPTAEEHAKRSRELAGTGNRLAASGQFEMAIKCFTDAIKFNPREYRLFGNRSLCYERTEQFENALRDADLALCMAPNWIKGLFRKGKALCGLKRYYEASLIYEEVLQLESSSAEAKQELKRAQTLHLMEMGFSWAQSNEALKTHVTLEEAVEALFAGHNTPQGAGVSEDNTDEPSLQEDEGEDEEWTVLQANRSRGQQVKVSGLISDPLQNGSKSESPTRHLRGSVKPELFSIWVGSLAPAVTYALLHELFSRVGVIYSIKMLLEHECAFVNYTRMEDCDRAIQCFNGMVLEGALLTVRYPIKGHGGLNLYKKECFFWRTTGCTRQDCTFKHVPEHKNIDRDKFTKRLGYANIS
ncbi:uncharacterized protein [Paralichthys olivaceus]|uniref:uncharacterized protein isoform X2 n=1 Tax=Paralichthys olivaceus TaxID=8255 RepID=UPI00097DA480|nr:PREDICTED: uncharacterized protein LOC109641248 isoform X4 [Paralichthys olivaceus]